MEDFFLGGGRKCIHRVTTFRGKDNVSKVSDAVPDSNQLMPAKVSTRLPDEQSFALVRFSKVSEN